MQKFTWTWKSGAYFVNQPGYDGGDMYLASEVDAEIAKLKEALEKIANGTDDDGLILGGAEMQEIAIAALGL